MPIPPKKMWKFKEIHRFWLAPESQQKDSLVSVETGHLVIKILQHPIIGFLQNWKPFQKMFSHHLPFLFNQPTIAHHLFLFQGFQGLTASLRFAPLRSMRLPSTSSLESRSCTPRGRWSSLQPAASREDEWSYMAVESPGMAWTERCGYIWWFSDVMICKDFCKTRMSSLTK